MTPNPEDRPEMACEVDMPAQEDEANMPGLETDIAPAVQGLCLVGATGIEPLTSAVSRQVK